MYVRVCVVSEIECVRVYVVCVCLRGVCVCERERQREFLHLCDELRTP